MTKVLQKSSWSSPLPTIWILSKSLIFIGCHGNRKAKFLGKNIYIYSNIFFSEAIREMKLKLCINVRDISLYIIFFFFFFFCRCLYAFVAMTTWGFHIHVLILGKVEIGIYFCVTADILTKVLLKCLWSSPLSTIWILSKWLILIGGHGNRKAKAFEKKINKIKSSSQKPYGGWSWNFAYRFVTVAST